MSKIHVFLAALSFCAFICGCSISSSRYDAVVAERDKVVAERDKAFKTEADLLKQNRFLIAEGKELRNRPAALQVAELDKLIEKLTTDARLLVTEKQRVKEVLAESQTLVETHEAELHRLQTAIEKLKTDVQKLTAEKKQLEKALADSETLVKKLTAEQ